MNTAQKYHTVLNNKIILELKKGNKSVFYAASELQALEAFDDLVLMLSATGIEIFEKDREKLYIEVEGGGSIHFSYLDESGAKYSQKELTRKC